jgi:inner membrane protein
MRGLDSVSPLNWHGLSAAFEPASLFVQGSSGLHAKLLPLRELLEHSKSHIAFNYELRLQGMEQITFVPWAMEFELQLTADWPYPRFDGHYAPDQLTVTEKGYQANWRLSAFSTGILTNINACEQGDCDQLWSNEFGVSHLPAVDVYQQLKLTVEYAFLLIGLCFVALFVYELCSGQHIYPWQYAVLGLALSIFYLLLLALSEQLNFVFAYIIATLCSVALVGYWLSFSIDRLAAVWLSLLMLVLYSVLLVIIHHPKIALLSVAGGALVALFAVMNVTRHINWATFMTADPD